ncbi:Aste57867_8513 [Aphanomyces stellatus]|uniref:Aste57867_8513 protein n=1 Tax=Aphanomyces stellatus TaxID=120398 RepID=A0A485KKG1_9STRA|nr:hypothetical protein As57867_008481 [Aphanomyces stellatus]VFT85399.1 Aste57867_8513 [Aphanomyces stellatus]
MSGFVCAFCAVVNPAIFAKCSNCDAAMPDWRSKVEVMQDQLTDLQKRHAKLERHVAIVESSVRQREAAVAVREHRAAEDHAALDLLRDSLVRQNTAFVHKEEALVAAKAALETAAADLVKAKAAKEMQDAATQGRVEVLEKQLAEVLRRGTPQGSGRDTGDEHDSPVPKKRGHRVGAFVSLNGPMGGPMTVLNVKIDEASARSQQATVDGSCS